MDNSKATNFLFRQKKARKNTFSLLVLFGLGVVFTIAVPYIALIYGSSELWNPSAFWTVTIVVGGWILGASLLKMIELTSGGKSVAIALGGRELLQSTHDIKERRLLNIVEEISIASGVSVPTVYLLDNEKSINAFASGQKPSNAVIGVTRGALDTLNRDELQGVIAHEFSHILNGDMSLNLKITALVFGLLALTELAYVIMRIGITTSEPRSNKSSNEGNGTALASIIVAAIIYIVSLISVFFGKLIQAAVSREREHLADASAVEFTRNPRGLASALKKIAALEEHSYLSTPKAGEVAHLFFANGINGFLGRIFSTHPPLMERIKLLDPQFNGDISGILSTQAKNSSSAFQKTYQHKEVAEMQNVTTVSAFTDEQYQENEPGNLSSIDEVESIVRANSSNALDSISVIFALLLDKKTNIQLGQIKDISLIYGKFLGAKVSREYEKYSGLSLQQKLNATTLLLPVLRQMSELQYNQFCTVLKKLINADNKVDLFEFCLLKNIENTLSGYFKPKKQHSFKKHEILSSISLLFSVLAYTEDCPLDEKIKAVQNAVNYLGIDGVTFIQIEDHNLDTLDKALDNLYFEDKSTRESLLQACTIILKTTNGQINDDEQALLNAIRFTLN